jgi:hypothetical protein
MRYIVSNSLRCRGKCRRTGSVSLLVKPLTSFLVEHGGEHPVRMTAEERVPHRAWRLDRSRHLHFEFRAKCFLVDTSHPSVPPLTEARRSNRSDFCSSQVSQSIVRRDV